MVHFDMGIRFRSRAKLGGPLPARKPERIYARPCLDHQILVSFLPLNQLPHGPKIPGPQRPACSQLYHKAQPHAACGYHHRTATDPPRYQAQDEPHHPRRQYRARAGGEESPSLQPL